MVTDFNTRRSVTLALKRVKETFLQVRRSRSSSASSENCADGTLGDVDRLHLATSGTLRCSSPCSGRRLVVRAAVTVATAAAGVSAVVRCADAGPRATVDLRRRRTDGGWGFGRGRGRDGFLAWRDGDNWTRLTQRGVVRDSCDYLSVFVVDVGVDARAAVTTHAYNTTRPVYSSSRSSASLCRLCSRAKSVSK